MTKVLKQMQLFTTDPSWEYEDYLDYCEEMEIEPVPEDSHEYWEFLQRQTENDWGDLEANLECSGANAQPCMIIGSAGLWDGRHEIIPVLCDTIWGAIEKCVSGNYDKEFDIDLNEGHIDITVHHHDGTNCYEIWLLSERGKTEVARPIYQWEKDYDPKRWWFKLIRGYLF